MNNSDMETSFTEFPVVYPCHVASKRRYVIHDEEEFIFENESSASTTPSADSSPFRTIDQLAGSASVSCLREGLLVTTCALPDEPTVVSVSFTRKGRLEARIELDLGHTSIFSTPVQIRCFDDFRLLMVDARGIVLSIPLDRNTWTPTHVSVVSIPDLLDHGPDGADPGAVLLSSMVIILSSTSVLVALSPYLLTVDLTEKEIFIWSETKTIELMKNATLAGVLSKASDLLLGRADDDDNSGFDISPTAALCQAVSTLDESRYIFTFHADGTLRRWRLDSYFSPVEVVAIKMAPSDIPEPSLWSDSYNSVFLSACLCGSAYALAVHIQTVDNCQITFVHGSQDFSGSLQSSSKLLVPDAAASLVGMDFVSSQNRILFTALFQDSSSNAILATYLPSVMHVIRHKPLVTNSSRTLDGVASLERNRISSLSFIVNDGTRTTLEEDLHHVDKCFLRYLFRPAYPRGNGSVTPPLSSCIRSAMSKLVVGHGRDAGDRSIELETLRAMNDWRRLERGGMRMTTKSTTGPGRQQVSALVTATTPVSSIYASYVTDESSEDTDTVEVAEYHQGDEDDDDAEEAQQDEDRIAQVEAQQQRWKKLLLTIWDEERNLRIPLCWKSTGNLSEFILIRAGVTTAFTQTSDGACLNTDWDVLDEAAINLLQRIQNSQKRSNALHDVETKVWDMVSKASLVFSLQTEIKECTNDISVLGLWAMDNGDSFTVDGIVLHQVLGRCSVSDILNWLQRFETSIARSLPGLSLLSGHTDVTSDTESMIWRNTIAGSQTRHAACSMYIRSVDSIRCLQLGRCLLLFSLDGTQELDTIIHHAAFRSYLQSIAVLWTCAQVVPMPSPSFHTRGPRHVRFGNVESGKSSPPTKRVNLGDDVGSIVMLEPTKVSGTTMTTALDVHMIQIAQTMDEYESTATSPIAVATIMARGVFNSSFVRNATHSSNAIPSRLLPELGVLPPPADQTIASDYPRLALRLLAPFLAYPPANDTVHVAFARNEAVSECLLIESNALSVSRPESKTEMMRHRACDLLEPSAGEHSPEYDHGLLESAFFTLLKMSEAMPPQDRSSLEQTSSEQALAIELQMLLHGGPSGAGPDISRLIGQPTVRSLFLPLMQNDNQSFFHNLDDDALAGVKALAAVLLRLSELMHRLSILERHTGNVVGSVEHSGRIEFLLKYIVDTISVLRTTLPQSVYPTMTEYASLLSLLFRHAVSAREWSTGYLACVDNPVHERKISNYKRLVTVMVEAGALKDLINLCSLFSTNISAAASVSHVEGGTTCIDLYEIATETLVEARRRDIYSAQSLVCPPDYLECLYALHVSQGHWERAAQAMDLRYGNATKALSTITESRSVQTDAIEDLVLTSLGASNAIHLVQDTGKRFLIAGEVDPFPVMPTMTDCENGDTSSRNNKRGRGGDDQPSLVPIGVSDNGTREMPETSRLPRLMTSVFLSCRAVRSMAIRTVVKDRASSFSLRLFQFDSLSPDSDRNIIDKLASLGYYLYGFLLAKAMAKSYEARTGSSRPNGRDILHDAVSHMLCSYVAAVASKSFSMTQSAVREEIEGAMDERPTLSQLCIAIDEIGGAPGTVSYVTAEKWGAKTLLPEGSKATAAMELLRKWTTARSRSSNPIALEVAECLLDLDHHRASLPMWLERHLSGTDAQSSNEAPGLFSLRSDISASTCKGDPSALLGIYMERGMYMEACELVTAVLTVGDGSGDRSRHSRAAARLPESGDIDYIPYNKIDLLWNLIEVYLNDAFVGDMERETIHLSRLAMEHALEQHFELLEISEMGMRSARALRQ